MIISDFLYMEWYWIDDFFVTDEPKDQPKPRSIILMMRTLRRHSFWMITEFSILLHGTVFGWYYCLYVVLHSNKYFKQLEPGTFCYWCLIHLVGLVLLIILFELKLATGWGLEVGWRTYYFPDIEKLLSGDSGKLSFLWVGSFRNNFPVITW